MLDFTRFLGFAERKITHFLDYGHILHGGFFDLYG